MNSNNKRLINNFSKQLKRSNAPTIEIEGADESKGILDQIRACEKDGKSFMVTFAYSTYEGDLKSPLGNGVVLVMKEETLKEDIPYYNTYIKDRYIGVPLEVKVDKIDDKEGIVYLRSSDAKKRNSKPRVLKIIFDELAEKEKKEESEKDEIGVVYAGRVVQVKSERIIVDILGLKILGMCYVKDWRSVYTRTFDGLVHVGEVYDFEIVKQLPKKKGRDYAFQLSRKRITPDPWKNLPEEFSQLNSVLMVKCIEKPSMQGKRYWWGRCPLLPDIEIMGDYSNKVGKVMIGVTYKCKVNAVDPEKHMFRVVPFAISDTDLDIRKAVDFIQNKK